MIHQQSKQLYFIFFVLTVVLLLLFAVIVRIPLDVPAGNLKTRSIFETDAFIFSYKMRPIPKLKEKAKVVRANFFSSTFKSIGILFPSTVFIFRNKKGKVNKNSS